jgi:hypothetical protein
MNQELTTTIECPVKSPRRALMDMILDLVELDLDAPENQDFIKETFLKIGAKVENYQWAQAHIESQRTQLKLEREHIDCLIKQCDKADERMSEYIKLVLSAANAKEIKGDNGARIYTKVYHKVRVLDEKALPDWAKTKKIEVVVNKAALAEAMKANQKIDGACLFEETYGYVSRPKKKRISADE